MFSSIQLNFSYSIIPSYLSLYSNISITFVPNSNAVGFSGNIYSTASLFSSSKATNASPSFFNNDTLYIPLKNSNHTSLYSFVTFLNELQFYNCFSIFVSDEFSITLSSLSLNPQYIISPIFSKSFLFG